MLGQGLLTVPLLLALVACQPPIVVEHDEAADDRAQWQAVQVANAEFQLPIGYDATSVRQRGAGPCPLRHRLPGAHVYVTQRLDRAECREPQYEHPVSDREGIGVYATVLSASRVVPDGGRELTTTGGATGRVSDRAGLQLASFPHLDALLIVDGRADPELARLVIDSVSPIDAEGQLVEAGGLRATVPESWEAAAGPACLAAAPALSESARDLSDVACAFAPHPQAGRAGLVLYGTTRDRRDSAGAADFIAGQAAFRVLDEAELHLVVPELATGLVVSRPDHPVLQRILATAYERP
jgi:hypothetical protein